MGTISLTAKTPVSYTVTYEPYGLHTPRLSIKDATGRPYYQKSAAYGRGTSATFTIEPGSFSSLMASCATCDWKGSLIYTIYLDPDQLANSQPPRTVETGTVVFTGPVPCSTCGGEDPDAEEPPPGGGGTGGGPGDDPYGGGEDDPRTPGPAEPPSDSCLPPPFVAPTPTIPTPCSSGTPGPGGIGFS